MRAFGRNPPPLIRISIEIPPNLMFSGLYPGLRPDRRLGDFRGDYPTVGYSGGQPLARNSAAIPLSRDGDTG